MPKDPHLVAYASPHGFGHAAIIRAVVVTLLAMTDNVRVSVVSRAPAAFFAEVINDPRFTLINRQCDADFGMLMDSFVDVRVLESLAAYRQAHENWAVSLQYEKDFLTDIQSDSVLTCISYLPLAAAQALGIPGYAVGPFSWYDIVGHYAQGVLTEAEVQALLAPMRQAYACASGYFACRPAVPPAMTYPQYQNIGPVGFPAPPRREDLRHKLGARAGEKIAILSVGGISRGKYDFSRWPGVPGWRWVVPGQSLGHLVGLDHLGFSVGEAIASCDAVITKSGYGTYVEAACAGAMILSHERPDWPENDGLRRWAEQYVGFAEVSEACFAQGDFAEALAKAEFKHACTHAARQNGVSPTGNTQVAQSMLESLRAGY